LHHAGLSNKRYDRSRCYFTSHSQASRCITKTQDRYIIKKREKDGSISCKVCYSAAAKDYFGTTIVIQQRIEATEMMNGKTVKIVKIKLARQKINQLIDTTDSPLSVHIFKVMIRSQVIL
jgi:hypothetical protein